jgi:hypothetical protein
VLGYQSRTQFDLLKGWLGEVRAERLALALIGSGSVLLGGLALWLLKPWRGRPGPQQRQFRRFEQLLLRHGLLRKTAEGPRDFAVRAAGQLPAQAELIDEFIRLWEDQQYAGRRSDPARIKRVLRRLRRALPWRLTRAMEGS